MRESIETASLPAIRAISGWPKWVPFVLILGLMVAGVFIPTYGWVLIAVVAVFLSWLLYLSWPRLTGAERVMRFAVIAVVLAAAVTRANPRTAA